VLPCTQKLKVRELGQGKHHITIIANCPGLFDAEMRRKPLNFSI